MSRSRSHDIALASTRRVTLAGSSVARMGEEASKEARKQLERIIMQLGKDCAGILHLKKRKTVDVDTLSYVIEKSLVCKGVKNSDLIHVLRKGEPRGLANASTVRAFKKALGGKYNVSDDAKSALVGISEAYLKYLGDRSATLAKAGGRKTIQRDDILAVAAWN